MGMTDRGADISWLSQYPHEAEVLFGPLTGIEVQRTRIDGSVVVIECAFSVNLTALTLEQQQALKVNANPNLTIREINPDRAINPGVSKSDLVVATTELTMFSPGLFEIESLGLVHDDAGAL